MKKLFMAVLTFILISFSAVGLAARFDTCALLIADADMKTEDLLNAAGFALSRSMLADLVIAYCIENNMRSVWEVNSILENWGLETI